MTDFSIKLDGKEYKCNSSQSDSQGNQNWYITVEHGSVKSTINIPMEDKTTRAKVILFIEAFHVAMRKAFEAQCIDQNYVWNQKTSIK